MDEASAPKLGRLRRTDAVRGACRGGQVCHALGVSDGVRRLHVDEISHRLQRGIKLGTDEPVSRRGRGRQNGVPRLDGVDLGEQRLGDTGEGVG